MTLDRPTEMKTLARYVVSVSAKPARARETLGRIPPRNAFLPLPLNNRLGVKAGAEELSFNASCRNNHLQPVMPT